MDEQIEQLVIGVRADTQGFARDVATMRGQLEGPLADGAGRAGKSIETALARAIASGKTGFDDLKKIALSAMEQIAAASLRSLFQSSGGSGGGAADGLLGNLSGLLGGLLGSPGRATGGPVSSGRPYMVGESGPELFVPSSSGRIERMGSTARGVNVSIAVTTPTPSDPQALRQSSTQVARAVRSAIRRGGQ
jgi:phage-related minor tail protein